MHRLTVSFRLLALAALLGLIAGSTVEPLFGALRDGRVHHETAESAVSHQAAVPGEHGHEDDGAHQHGSQHEHGTASDHCTHVHGVAVPAVLGVRFASSTAQLADVTPPCLADRSVPIHGPPPRA